MNLATSLGPPGRWYLRQQSRRAARQREVGGWLPTRERVLWIVACIALVVAPHLLRLPLWIPALFVVACAWRVAVPMLGWHMPPRWAVAGLGICALPLIYFSFGTLLGRNAGVATLVVLSGIKLLETRTMRDAASLTYLGFFLIVTNFLYSQTIGTGIYMLCVVLLMTASLTVTGSHSPRLRTGARLSLASKLLLQAAPIALLLFLLFPRIPGPLWGLPNDAFSAVSGLSNSMSPGSISQLGLSDEVAFRVQFEGERPEARELYWRGPVLAETDGVEWWPSRRRSQAPAQLRFKGEPLGYTVTLEANSQKWRFGLDAVRDHPPGLRVTDDLRLVSNDRLNKITRYRLTSHLDYQLDPVRPEELQETTTLPRGMHPGARELAESWRDASDNPRDIVASALDHFRNQPFRYTLEPPLLEGDRVDDFLFSSQAGFCEHYAAAFVVLMRAANVPARVVTGYQGGEYNELGDYLLVRQRDAHAWAEVWFRDAGWVRIDPTSAVAPERIELGLDAAIPSRRAPAALTTLGAGAAEPLIDMWQRMRKTADAVNHRWNQWVLGYGPSRQRELLSRLGIDSGNVLKLAAITFAAVFAVLLLVGVWLLRPRRRHRDPVSRAWHRFGRLAARAGCERHAHEGPRDFARRAAESLPGWAPAITRIAALYEVLRYAPPEAQDQQMLNTLQQEVAQLRRLPAAGVPAAG